MFDWLRSHEALVAWIGVGSLVFFAGSLIAAPMLLARIPADSFATEEPPPSPFAEHHPLLRLAVLVLRNLVGVFLVLMGIAMLALPGQGVLTIVLGFFALDFPGKRRLELKLLRRRRVLGAVNWMRHRAGREPLRVAGASDEELERARPR